MVFVLAGMPIATLSAQTAFTWQQIKDKFEAANPTLKAAQLNIDESRAAEITAYLRPNPDFTLSADGFQITPELGSLAAAQWRCGNARHQLSARTRAQAGVAARPSQGIHGHHGIDLSGPGARPGV